MVIPTFLSDLCHDLVLRPSILMFDLPNPSDLLYGNFSGTYIPILSLDPLLATGSSVIPIPNQTHMPGPEGCLMPSFQPAGPPSDVAAQHGSSEHLSPQTCHAAIYASQLQLTRELSAHCKVPSDAISEYYIYR